MPNVAGIDVGLTLKDPTSGVCRSGDRGLLLRHTYIDRFSRASQFENGERFDVLAIDAPILRIGQLVYEVRPCEKVFVWGAFQTRCKPGETQIRGTGQALRRGGCETAEQFASWLSKHSPFTIFPRIQHERDVIEAFPNGFLGVLLTDDAYAQMPRLNRNEKFDWLMDRCVDRQAFDGIRQLINWPDDDLWKALLSNSQHDERAALICAVTAACVWAGYYVAVGEKVGGYFFLPPWRLWQTWAKDALQANRNDRRLPRQIEVWIDGHRYSSNDELPN